MTTPDLDWQTRAACRTQPVSDTHHPHRADFEAIWQARRVCHRCPVRNECLTHALTVADQHGVWGGQHPGERRRIGEGRRPQRCHGCRLLHVPRLPGTERCVRCAHKHNRSDEAAKARKVLDDNQAAVLDWHARGCGPTLIGRTLGVPRDAVRAALRRWRSQTARGVWDPDLVGVR